MLYTPSLGKTILVVANAVILIILCFYKLDVSDLWSFEDIGYRTGFITICQLPLLFLLAGKRNIIGALVGTSHERLNWLHRWASRTLLLTATIHMGYWFADWAPFDYIGTKITTDSITKHGVIAWAVLVWIVISSMTPIRGWNYEFFVVQHIISFAAFIGVVYLHTPAEVHIYLWICVGLFFFDRLLRAGIYMYSNLSLFHKTPTDASEKHPVWGCNAEFTPVTGDVTRITIRNPPRSWQPGQHVFLSCHALAPLQAHPFTIASLPSDGQMDFFVQSRGGSTKRFSKYAGSLLPTTNMDQLRSVKTAVIEGPYGSMRDQRQFDSVVLFAGSTGATFITPLLRNIVRGWRVQERIFGKQVQTVTRHVRFVWVIKSGTHLEMFKQQLEQVMADVESAREAGMDVQVKMSVYVTCDETFTSSHETARQPNPAALHGAVTSLDEKTGLFDKTYDEEKGNTITTALSTKGSDDDSSIHSTDSCRSRSVKKAGTCGSGTGCCCRMPIEEGSASSASRPVCRCNGCPGSSSAVPAEKITATSSQSLLHPSIALYSGRPVLKELTRSTLEQARGESAVVACGPRGLLDDVRSSTVALSDERAVGKGSGAHGVWLHIEGFGY